MREEAYRSHLHECTIWAITGPYSKKPKKPPALPAILKKNDDS